MAANKCPVTPDRVRKILSTFLSEETKKQTSDGEDHTEEAQTSPQKSNDAASLKQQESLNPRSRESFFKRVETFSPLTWFAKPEELSALVCAQYGWENTEIDMLKCVSCKAYLCGKLPSNTDRVAYKEGCGRLKESIITAHEKLCSWSTNPAPDWYMQVPHYDPEQVRQDFHQRYSTLKTVSDTLPEINYTKLSSYGFDTYRCGKMTYSLDQNSEEGIKKAAALAVTGWTMNKSKITLVCDHCRRQAGLWNFKCTTRTTETEEESDPPVKRQRLDGKESFDPSEEHRTFCPWIRVKNDAKVYETPSSQSQTSSQTANQNSGQNGTQSDFGSPSLNTSQSLDNSQIGSPGLNCSQDSNTSSDSIGSPEKQEKKRLPGWVRNLRIIAPTLLCDNTDSLSSTIKKSPIVVGLRSIRRLFRDWASPDVKKAT